MRFKAEKLKAVPTGFGGVSRVYSGLASSPLYLMSLHLDISDTPQPLPLTRDLSRLCRLPEHKD